MKFECPQHADKQTRTHTLTTHSTTKSFENPEGAISKSAKEKRMIILLRVNLGAFCDYGYLFGAARYSQRQNERKYRSLLGYENTCRPQIISRLSLHNTHSLALSQLLSPSSCSSTLVSFAFYHLLIFFGEGSSGEKSLPLVFSGSCLRGSLLEIVLTKKTATKQISISQESALWISSFVNTAAERAMDGGCKRSEVSPSVHHTYGLQKMVPIFVVTLKSFYQHCLFEKQVSGNKEHIWIFWIKT